MGLLGNGVRLHKMPLSFVGGGAGSLWNGISKEENLLNIYTSPSVLHQSAIPDGYRVNPLNSANWLRSPEDFRGPHWTLGGAATVPSANFISFGSASPSNYVRQTLLWLNGKKSQTVTYQAKLSGSGNVVLRVSNGVDDVSTDAITLSSTPTIYTFSKTFNTTTASGAYIQIHPTTALSCTVEFMQASIGASLTDYIPTSLTSTQPKSYASWLLPLKTGGMSARVNDVSVSASGNGAAGVNVSGPASMSVVSADADGQMIVSGAGGASLSLNASGNILASLNGAGSTSLSVSPIAASISAKAWASASANISVTGSMTSYAVGHMQGSALPYTELSPQSLAEAVGQRIIEAGLSQDEITRILLAVAAGKATGLEGTDPKFFALDGVTVRVDGSYSGGNRTIDALNGA